MSTIVQMAELRAKLNAGAGFPLITGNATITDLVNAINNLANLKNRKNYLYTPDPDMVNTLWYSNRDENGNPPLVLAGTNTGIVKIFPADLKLDGNGAILSQISLMVDTTSAQVGIVTLYKNNKPLAPYINMNPMPNNNYGLHNLTPVIEIAKKSAGNEYISYKYTNTSSSDLHFTILCFGWQNLAY